MKIVVSLTTIPSRIARLTKTLESIYNQNYSPDAIYLGIPRYSIKEQCLYPQQELPRVRTVWLDKDYGPLCKLLGALVAEQDPDTIVLTLDDDMYYPPNLIQELVQKMEKHPTAAIGSSGFKIGTFPFYWSWVMNQPEHNRWWCNFDYNHGQLVDVLAGYPGAAYRRSFFPRDIKELTRYTKDNNIHNNDDVLISAWLSSQGIDRIVYPMPKAEHTDNKTNGIADDVPKFCWRLIKAIQACDRAELFKTVQRSVHFVV